MNVTGLRQAIDNTGNPYLAVRPRLVQLLTTATASAVNTAALQPQTKVVRICAASDVVVGIAGITGTFLVAAAHYQDIIVYPGDVLSLQAVSSGASASVMELM
jgi:hypothetical protein